jgi:hypothetical protein
MATVKVPWSSRLGMSGLCLGQEKIRLQQDT